jgi:hypothetical protein
MLSITFTIQIKRLLFPLASVLLHYNILAQCIKGNCKDGDGEMLYPDKTRFVGSFEGGKRKKGIFYYNTGDKYDGSFTNNARHGYGIYSYKTGEEFVGIYEENQKKYGTYIYKNGNIYVGPFSENKPNGYGTMNFPDGSAEEGIWENGKLAWKTSLQKIPEDTIEDASILPVSEKKAGATAPRIFGLIIGVSDYQNGFAADLRYADDDAVSMYRYLKGAFPSETQNGSLKLLLNSSAAASEIRNEMTRIFAMSGENDYLIFYFSGHGSSGSFVPYNHQNDRITHAEVRSAFKNATAKYRLCLADACYSGSIRYQNQEVTTYENNQDLSDARLAVLLSSASTETSLESGAYGHGIFTYCLLTGLKGAADFNQDKYITSGELFAYAKKAVKEKTKGAQVPVVIGKNLHKIPLGRLR